MFSKLLNPVSLIFIMFFMTACVAKNKHDCSLVPATPKDSSLPALGLNEELNLPGEKFANTIFVRDSYAYIGVGNTLVMFDISDVSNPLLIGDIPLPHNADSIVVADSYAFVSDDSQPGESTVIDISDPHRLVKMTCQQELMPSFFKASPSKEYVYVPSWEDEKLYVYHVDSNTSPIDIVEVGTYQSRTPIQLRLLPKPEVIGAEPRAVIDIILVENYAFVAENSLGGEGFYRGQVQVLDVSNPQSLKPVATYIMPQRGSAIQLFSSENYIFVATGISSGYPGLILDILDPTAPSLVTMITGLEIPIGMNGNFAYSVIHFEDGTATIRVRDITNPNQIIQTDWDPSTYGWTFGWQGDVTFAENHAYFMDSNLLRIIDISDPFYPVLSSVVSFR